MKNQEDWLQHLSQNFLKVVSEGKIMDDNLENVLENGFMLGLEASRRESTLKKIKERGRLSAKQNSAVIHTT